MSDIDKHITEARRILRTAALCDSAPVLSALVAEVERPQRIKDAAQTFIEASARSDGPYTEEQRAYDALVEALAQE